MSKIQSIVRLRYEDRLPLAATATAIGTSKGTMSNTLERLEQSDLSWWLAPQLPANQKSSPVAVSCPGQAGRISAWSRWLSLASSLQTSRDRRRVGLKRNYLWRDNVADAASRSIAHYGYSQFCVRLKRAKEI